MKSKNSKGYSLVEIIIALLILTCAVIPLIGTITSDTKNAIVIANSEYAMQRARYILDTMLDSVEFDDVNSGDPAFLSGKSKDYFSLLMFPESDGKFCQGYFSDEKGQRYFASLKVVDIPDDDKILKFECYENPDLISLLNNRIHTVVTGVCVKSKDKEISFNSKTFVKFAFMSDEEINN